MATKQTTETETETGPAGFPVEDAPQGALPADVEANLRATKWHEVQPGKQVPVPIPATVGAGGYKNASQAKSNRAYDVLEVVREMHPAPDGYKWGTKRNTFEDGMVTVRVVLKRATS